MNERSIHIKLKLLTLRMNEILTFLLAKLIELFIIIVTLGNGGAILRKKIMNF